MMVERPSITVTASLGEPQEVSGDLSRRARSILEALGRSGRAGVRVTSRAREHAGLGVGTQLSLAIGKALDALEGRDRDASAIARDGARGCRSAIGIHGFERGGLLVDGGHDGRAEQDTAPSIAPLLGRFEVPASWRVVLAIPREPRGLSGERELGAFRDLDASELSVAERHARSAELCHGVLLELLPSLTEHDFTRFSRALAELQRRVGEVFARAQGGLYSSRESAAISEFFRAEGVEGVGQSSWGPTVFAFTEDEERAAALVTHARERFDLGADELFATAPRNRGAERI